jgi:adenylate cyclase
MPHDVRSKSSGRWSSSAFTYKGRATDAREIGKELGVAYLLEGSVQKVGNRLRIIVQLIETEAGAHVWSSRYDGTVDDFFDLQDRITRRSAAFDTPCRNRALATPKTSRPQQLRLHHEGHAPCLGA